MLLILDVIEIFPISDVVITRLDEMLTINENGMGLFHIVDEQKLIFAINVLASNCNPCVKLRNIINGNQKK